jgi:hypothetical protein
VEDSGVLFRKRRLNARNAPGFKGLAIPIAGRKSERKRFHAQVSGRMFPLKKAPRFEYTKFGCV